MTYALLKIAEFIIQNIPRKAGYFVFRAAAIFLFMLGGKRKKNLRRNLEILTGGPVEDSLLKKVYCNYGLYYCDLFRDRDSIIKSFDGADFEKMHLSRLNSLIESGRGFIVVSLHMGNWDAAGTYFAHIFPGKANIVVEKLSPGMYRWFCETRARLGMNVIPSTDGKAMIRALRAGEPLVLASDRDLDRTGFIMDFFGHKAYIPNGAAKLSLLTGAPILVGGVIRKKEDDSVFYTFALPDMLNMPPVPRTPEAVEELTKEVVAAMEQVIKPYPDQWCMLQEVFVPEEEQKEKTKTNNIKPPL